MFGITGLKLAAGAALVAVLALGAWRLEALAAQRDEARAHLRDAISANASLIESRRRAIAEADAERDRALARQRERDGMAGQVLELRRALGDDPCAAWSPERAKALDEFLGGGVK